VSAETPCREKNKTKMNPKKKGSEGGQKLKKSKKEEK
jgi:hypothetical protein